MNRLSRLYLLALGVGFTLAAADQFTTIDYPGATSTNTGGINDAGDIVGSYTDTGGLNHGYLLGGGKFTPIDYAGARHTWANGINSAGDIVGQYSDGTRQYGYLLRQGAFTSLDCPGATFVRAFAINSAGDITGDMGRAGQPAAGLLISRGACTLTEYRPEAPSTTMTMYFGMNDAGVQVGHWGSRGTVYAVVHNKGTFTHFAHGGGSWTEVTGINNAGDMVGSFRESNGANHGFLLRNGRFTSIDFPGAVNTFASKINNSGQVVGRYVDSGNRSHGYVARVTPAGPPPPVLTVDDDGADCPGALKTIQEAVAQAPAGATILVCPGTYYKTVSVVGPEKTGLKLRAARATWSSTATTPSATASTWRTSPTS